MKPTMPKRKPNPVPLSEYNRRRKAHEHERRLNAAADFPPPPHYRDAHAGKWFQAYTDYMRAQTRSNDARLRAKADASLKAYQEAKGITV